jgi:ABC-type glycerol-3-phosphate transport system substrate-binding protein
MRKTALLAAVVLAAACSTVSLAQAQMADQNPNTTKLMQAATNPYGATSQPAKPMKHKHMRKHKKMMKKKM